jgi:hypothetical protein
MYNLIITATPRRPLLKFALHARITYRRSIGTSIIPAFALTRIAPPSRYRRQNHGHVAPERVAPAA